MLITYGKDASTYKEKLLSSLLLKCHYLTAINQLFTAHEVIPTVVAHLLREENPCIARSVSKSTPISSSSWLALCSQWLLPRMKKRVIF